MPTCSIVFLSPVWLSKRKNTGPKTLGRLALLISSIISRTRSPESFTRSAALIASTNIPSQALYISC